MRAGLHSGGGLHHLPAPGLCGVRGDPGFPGRLHGSNAGHAAAPLQLPEQVHGGHEVPIQHQLVTFVHSGNFGPLILPLGDLIVTNER